MICGIARDKVAFYCLLSPKLIDQWYKGNFSSIPIDKGCQIRLTGISGELTEHAGLCPELGIPGLGEGWKCASIADPAGTLEAGDFAYLLCSSCKWLLMSEVAPKLQWSLLPSWPAKTFLSLSSLCHRPLEKAFPQAQLCTSAAEATRQLELPFIDIVLVDPWLCCRKS